MKRRTLLVGIPLLAASLMPGSLSALEVEVSRLWGCYQGSQYQPIIDRLPGLLSQLQARLISGPDEEQRRCESVLALAYQLSATVLTKLGHQAPALSALDSGSAAAERSGNAVVTSSIKRSKAHTLLAFGMPAEAFGQVEETIRDLTRSVLEPSPNALSVLGTLHLVGAVAASQVHDVRRATEALKAAEAAASQLGHDANCLWTAFGPTNVGIHRVVVDVELGQVRSAIDLAPSIDTRSLPSERRARHAIEVARAFTLLGDIDEAARLLLEADAVAAEQIRNHRLSRRMVTSWLAQPRRREAVSSLADRMHIEVE